MFAIFTLLPNWDYATPLEFFLWAVAISMAAFFGIWFVADLTQDTPNDHGRHFRCTLLLLMSFALLAIGARVASHGHDAATAVRAQKEQPRENTDYMPATLRNVP